MYGGTGFQPVNQKSTSRLPSGTARQFHPAGTYSASNPENKFDPLQRFHLLGDLVDKHIVGIKATQVLG